MQMMSCYKVSWSRRNANGVMLEGGSPGKTEVRAENMEKGTSDFEKERGQAVATLGVSPSIFGAIVWHHAANR